MINIVDSLLLMTEDCRNIRYLHETQLKLKYCENSFVRHLIPRS